MGLVRAVIRVGVLWVLSVLVAVAGMGLARRVVLAIDRGDAMAQTTEGESSKVSVRAKSGWTSPLGRF